MRAIGFLACLAASIVLVACGAQPSTAPGGSTPARGASLQAASPDAAATPYASPRTITVSGSASVMVVPDEVTLTLGVETSDPQMAVAKASNDEIVARVLDVTRGMGIDPKYVQTDYMSIEPRYQDNYTQRAFLGYWVRKNVVVTLKDITKFEVLLTKCLEAGANYVQGIDFRTTELRRHRDRARSLAIQAAQEKAAAMAKDAGQEVGQPLTIHEDYTRWYSPWSSWWGSGASRGATQNVVQSAPSGTTEQRDDALAPGQVAIDASVTVAYELKSGTQ